MAQKPCRTAVMLAMQPGVPLDPSDQQVKYSLPKPDGAAAAGRDHLYAICPFGVTGPYATCEGDNNKWSELKGGDCPGDADVCPLNHDSNTETVPGGACRCKAGYAGAGACPTNMVLTSDSSACRCKAGWVPQLDTSWQGGNLACQMCPAVQATLRLPVTPDALPAAVTTSTALQAQQHVPSVQRTAAPLQTTLAVSATRVVPLLVAWVPASLAAALVLRELTVDQVCSGANSYWEAKGNACQCKAGYLQTGAAYYPGSYHDPICNGRRLQSNGVGSTRFLAAPDSLDMVTLVSTSSAGLQHGWPACNSLANGGGGPRLSARELKAALIKHYAGLLQLPSCLRVPSSVARRVRAALSNIVGMTTSTAARRGGELVDVFDSFTTVAELTVEVLGKM
ncbi:hypothetical protein COO60DRAFT_1460537 [Scenedesmus sp. NREL 46B-D3]|nr:hypothetical protein COO60DRAFT_1460537 [Scenedesmus sp. NREL 46B-D3]